MSQPALKRRRIADGNADSANAELRSGATRRRTSQELVRGSVDHVSQQQSPPKKENGLDREDLEGSSSSDYSSEDDAESSSSEESSDSDSSSEDGDDVAKQNAEARVTIAPQHSRRPSKPSAIDIDVKGSISLRQRLDAFLPQMRDANASLEGRDANTERSAIDIVNLDEVVAEDKDVLVTGGDTEDSEDDERVDHEPYIEMDLGLGVLEQQQDGEVFKERSSDKHVKDYGSRHGGPAGFTKQERKGVMDELLPQIARRHAPVIEEVEQDCH